MKKNLRIVSAAAALLAVAPVAASAVSTVSAAPTTDVDTNTNNLVYHAQINSANPWLLSKSNDGSWHVLTKEVQSTNDKGQNYYNSFEVKRSSDKISGHTLYNLGFDWAKTGTDPKTGQVTYVAARSVYQIQSGKYAGAYILSSDVRDLKPVQVVNGQDLPAGAYFSYEGRDYATGDTIYLNPKDSNVTDVNALENTVINKIKLLGVKDLSSTEAWHKFVFDEGNSTIKRDIMSQLQEQGISVDANGNFNAGAKAFSIKFLANGGKSITVVFQNTDAINAQNPVFQVRSDVRAESEIKSTVSKTEWGQPFNDPQQIPTINIVKRDSGSFNPTDYIQASDHVETVNDAKKNNVDHYVATGRITFTTKSNNVDWTKPGLYSVEVTATNKAGKSTDLTIPVVVNDVNGKVMTAINDAQVYTESNGAMVQANLVNNEFNKGSQVYVFGNPVTKKLNGQDTQFYRVLNSTSNFWVKASDLKDGIVTPTAQETTKTVTIMHISTIYDKNGKATHEPALRAYDTYSVVSTPVNLKDEKGKDAGMFYKLAGKDQYIKVGNVDGTKRSLKKNSYVYKSTGKAYMKSKKHHRVLKAGSSVTTYGKSFMIAGHQMYRIGENQYVKKANF